MAAKTKSADTDFERLRLAWTAARAKNWARGLDATAIGAPPASSADCFRDFMAAYVKATDEWDAVQKSERKGPRPGGPSVSASDSREGAEDAEAGSPTDAVRKSNKRDPSDAGQADSKRGRFVYLAVLRGRTP